MSKESKESKEAFKEIMRPAEPVAEAAQGGLAAILSAAKDIGGQVWDAAAPMANHGKTELAAALFSPHGSGFVMYGGHDRQNEQQAPDHGLPAIEAVKQPEAQKEQDLGLEM